MRPSTGASRVTLVWSLCIALVVWWVLTRFYSPLVVPTMGAVARKLAEIATSSALRQAFVLTMGRLLAGLAIGVAAGAAAGAALGFLPRVHAIVRPWIGLMQSVPPVSWLVLALIWFGFSGTASVFIVIVAAVPVMTINMVEGVHNIDGKLMQMAQLYRFSFRKQLRHVILPSIMPYFRAGVQVAVGIGSKSVVMGEVLTTSSGIGGEITNARLNLEPEGVVAWTILIVGLYYLLNALANALFSPRGNGKSNGNDSRPRQTL